MTFERGTVFVVSFPFTDIAIQKRRPAVAITDSGFALATGNVVLAMITSASHSQWPDDWVITNLSAVGLSKPSKIRLKIFTLAVERLGQPIGRLTAEDRQGFDQALRNGFHL